MVYIGVDLGGTTIKIGLIEKGRVISKTKIISKAEESFASRLKQIKGTVNELLQKENISSHALGGIGLAFPSIVDSKAKKILSKYVKFTDADEIDLGQWAKTSWGIPLALENDARAALVGEWQNGAGIGKNNIVMITLGTGLGSAALMDGKLLRGAHFLAGNLGGHMIINYKGDICNCGLRGCVESEASGWVLPQKFASYPGLANSPLSALPQLNFKAVFDSAQNGDGVAIEIRDHCLKAWGASVINLVHAFDPELIIMSGGIMNSKDQIIPPIQAQVNKDLWLPEQAVEIVAAQQIEDAGILGMGYLAAQ